MFSFLPEGAQPDNMRSYDSSWILFGVDDRTFREVELEFMRSELTKDPSKCLLFQITYSRASLATPGLSLDEELLLLPMRSDELPEYPWEGWAIVDHNNFDRLEVAVGSDSMYVDLVGFYSYLPVGFQRERPIHRGDGDLKRFLVQHADGVLVHAFDTEIWMFACRDSTQRIDRCTPPIRLTQQ